MRGNAYMNREWVPGRGHGGYYTNNTAADGYRWC